ncbi:MAG: alkaline phosphatase D family protein [Nostoc sp. DedQUE04]|uniref:alkaline phosphatase D family protein n=1 Tax=Nostoc sp. DedQUE04 TaxID=3075390 RepID=UPI002AD56732|nr:alkaline phosphatase D family protein [Nostoc sp. DedQUE04]MDZ8140873.1 alkaline phosphatase D family protein [Nostoc sp. DedQUE04]
MQNFNFERLLSSRLRRRQVLIGTGALTGFAIANQWFNKVLAQPRFSNYPFSLGVASGEPLPDNVVLWTRLAPDPLNGGGMPPYNVPVQWQIATDEKMRQVVHSGTQMATPEFGHSVHVEVQGLQPARWYWYQFRVGNEVSPIGRTRTAPNPRDRVERFRFAFASCQNWQSGYYAAYKNMAQEDLDLVVHLGDYIYEGAPSTTALRPHNGNGEPFSLQEYRNRHALYKSDPNLKATHAAFPWLVTWDDHEVDNNWADEIPQDPEVQSRSVFLARRAAAFQVYYEHMPLRPYSIPRGIDMQLYRRLTFGDLVEFNVLDTRQYRTNQPCGDGRKPRCADATDPTATMTGSEQERWLFEGLDRSSARWNVIAQQIVMAQFDYDTGAGEVFNLDQWDGYVASRNRILGFIQQRRPSNPVVISGDWHSSWVNDLKANFDDSNSQTVATEFVGTSISSSCPWTFDVEAALPQNPWVKYFNGRLRGYVRCDLNRERWRSDYRLLPQSQPTEITVSNPNASVITAASFELPNQGVVAKV